MHVCQHMQLETKFLRLRKLATVGDEVDGWRVSWLGGWDSAHLFYWVMVVRVKPAVDFQSRGLPFSVPQAAWLDLTRPVGGAHMCRGENTHETQKGSGHSRF